MSKIQEINVGQNDFIYKVDSSLFPESDIVRKASKKLTSLVLRHIKEEGIRPLEIEAMSLKNVRDIGGEAAAKAFDTLASHFGVDKDKENPAIVFCQSASIHNDPYFSGLSFVSRVLSTGTGKNEGPYLINVSSGAMENGEVLTSSLVVSQGDTFVFDPSVPHCAFAVEPSRTSFLVLFQWELAGETKEEKETILNNLPMTHYYQTHLDYL